MEVITDGRDGQDGRDGRSFSELPHYTTVTA
jgi:hypothetical protein